MAVVTCLLVLVRKIGIFFGLTAFVRLCSLAVVVVAVQVSVLNIVLGRRRYLLHLGRGGGGMLNVVHM
jgi:hypothetical protein